MTSRIKEGFCKKLNEIRLEDKLTYKDFRSFAEEDGYKLTDSQLNAIFTKNGDGVGMGTIEKIYESLDIKIGLYIDED